MTYAMTHAMTVRTDRAAVIARYFLFTISKLAWLLLGRLALVQYLHTIPCDHYTLIPSQPDCHFFL